MDGFERYYPVVSTQQLLYFEKGITCNLVICACYNCSYSSKNFLKSYLQSLYGWTCFDFYHLLL